MAKTPEELKACEVCGASIYPEHVKKGLADYLAGRLLCTHCLRDKRQMAMVNPAAVFRDENAAEPADEPIALASDDEDEVASNSASGVLSATRGRGGAAGGTGGGTTFAGPVIERPYQRALLKNANATRCRTFHCKLNDPSFARLNEVINEWVDANEDIEIKFATSCIGHLEAKHSTDPHLIVTVFY
jgi:hypothetical protein